MGARQERLKRSISMLANGSGEAPRKHSMGAIVVLKLVASCRWKCGLDKLLTILENKTLYRQLAIHAAASLQY
jgi:hypothetical protein